MKPILAVDAVIEKLVYPCIAMPKIDGVRGLNVAGKLRARSLKPFANRALMERFSLDEFTGFDGELASGNISAPDVCRKTTSLVTTIAGSPDAGWCLFDFVPDDRHAKLPYLQRYEILVAYVDELHAQNHPTAPWLWVVPLQVINNHAELIAFDDKCLNEGFEGTIIRSMDGQYKYGRTTQREATYLRIKRFMDAEAKVIEIFEGETNTNEAQTNELGRTFRSTHQEGKIANGMLGSMSCRILKDIFDAQNKDLLLLEKDQIVTVTHGRMTHEERVAFIKDPSLITNKIIKFQFFPKGQKDKPRFPTFQCFRDPVDM